MLEVTPTHKLIDHKEQDSEEGVNNYIVGENRGNIPVPNWLEILIERYRIYLEEITNSCSENCNERDIVCYFYSEYVGIDEKRQ